MHYQNQNLQDLIRFHIWLITLFLLLCFYLFLIYANVSKTMYWNIWYLNYNMSDIIVSNNFKIWYTVIGAKFWVICQLHLDTRIIWNIRILLRKEALFGILKWGICHTKYSICFITKQGIIVKLGMNKVTIFCLVTSTPFYNSIFVKISSNG